MDNYNLVEALVARKRLSFFSDLAFLVVVTVYLFCITHFVDFC